MLFNTLRGLMLKKCRSFGIETRNQLAAESAMFSRMQRPVREQNYSFWFLFVLIANAFYFLGFLAIFKD